MSRNSGKSGRKVDDIGRCVEVTRISLRGDRLIEWLDLNPPSLDQLMHPCGLRRIIGSSCLTNARSLAATLTYRSCDAPTLVDLAGLLRIEPGWPSESRWPWRRPRRERHCTSLPLAAGVPVSRRSHRRPRKCHYSPNTTPDATICAVRSVSFPRFTSVGLT